MRSAIVCDHMETYFCDRLRSCDHDRRRSQKIEPCSISCDRLRSDHLRSIAIVRSYRNQSFAIRDRNASHNISSSLPRFNARLFDCRNGLCYECVYYCSRKDFNDKNKEASYREKVGQKIHLSAEKAEAKFLQHKNCIRSLWNPKSMFSTVLELATTRLIMTNRRSKFACSKISALPRSRCCLLFSLHARVYLTFSLTKTRGVARISRRGGSKLVTITVGLKSLHYAPTRLWRSSQSGDAASFTTSFDEKSFQIKADFSKLQKRRKQRVL